MLKGSLVAVFYTLCVATTTYNMTDDYRVSRPPNEFIYIDKDAKGVEREVLNMMQIIRIDPTWDDAVPKAKRTPFNADWTRIKLTDGTIVIIKDTFKDVLNMMRNAQQ
mgnify:CR=1 FL=1